MALPLPGFHFSVEWGGTNVGFSEASGLTMETQVIEYRDGASPDYNSIKMPGLPKTANIVLKRGIVDGDKEFFSWLNQTFNAGHSPISDPARSMRPSLLKSPITTSRNGLPDTGPIFFDQVSGLS